MKFSIVFEKVNEPDLPDNYFYAYIPSLGLTTHGQGIDGAKHAALDLIKLWLEEKKENGEMILSSEEQLFATVEVE